MRSRFRSDLLLLGVLVFLLVACAPRTGSLPDTGAEETPAGTAAAGEETPVGTDIPSVQPSPTGETAGTPPAAALAAQKWLAEQLNVAVDQVVIGNSAQEEWPDACLGLAGPDEMCAQVITPGWRVSLQANGQTYAVHTDVTGSIVRMETSPVEDSLANTQWELVSLGTPGAEELAVGETKVTLQFEAGGQAGGSSGCNSYGGQYHVEGDTISFREVVNTLMACEDEAVMDQEQRYLGALSTAERFELTEERLTIWYDDGQGQINFEKASPGTGG